MVECGRLVFRFELMQKRWLVLDWGEGRSSAAGETEVLTDKVLRQLSEEGEVIVLTPAFEGCKSVERIEGIIYIRLGSKRVSYQGLGKWRFVGEVFKYYWKQIRGKQEFDGVMGRAFWRRNESYWRWGRFGYEGEERGVSVRIG